MGYQQWLINLSKIICGIFVFICVAIQADTDSMIIFSLYTKTIRPHTEWLPEGVEVWEPHDAWAGSSIWAYTAAAAGWEGSGPKQISFALGEAWDRSKPRIEGMGEIQNFHTAYHQGSAHGGPNFWGRVETTSQGLWLQVICLTDIKFIW